MKPILRTREALALCDYRRAKRTDPTPQQTERARREWHLSKLPRARPRFDATYCSQCGCDLGPGDAGVSRCADHRSAA